MEIFLDSVQDAVDCIKKGKIVIVVDDEDRENEGDMICASDCITPELVNFMVKEARGLMCIALTEERCKELNLRLMVADNTAIYKTAFTVSVDLLGFGCTSGVSAYDRAKTISALVDPDMKAINFGTPGHIFPLIANRHGLLGRTGHTEAAVDLARLAGFRPSGVLIEVLKEDGSMARLPDLRLLANRFGLKLVSIKDIIEYMNVNQNQIRRA
jgi:3,4-dihydroxy 2-butanone 4-phosphate synthase / GTP cyclohydrolase II